MKNKRLENEVEFEEEIVQLAAGGRHSMVLTNDGANLYAFGYGAHGQLGLGIVKNSPTPILVKQFIPPTPDPLPSKHF